MNDRVAAAWDTKYCQISEQGPPAAQTDAIMKCLRGSSHEHPFVNNWFESRFGLSFAEVNQVVGIVRE